MQRDRRRPEALTGKAADPVSMHTGQDGGVTLTWVRDCVVATLHANQQQDSFDQISAATLVEVGQGKIKAVIFDLSAVRVMDRHEFGALNALGKMLRLLGTNALVVGLSAGVVAYLVNDDIDTSGLEVARGLEEALNRIDTTRPGPG